MRGNYQSPGAAGRMLRQVIGYGFPEHNQPNRRANLRRCCCSPNQFNEEPPLARKKSIRVDINVNININVNGRSNKKGEHHDHRNETSFRPGTQQKTQNIYREDVDKYLSAAKFVESQQDIPREPAILHKSPWQRLARQRSQPALQTYSKMMLQTQKYANGRSGDTSVVDTAKPLASTTASRSNAHIIPPKPQPRMESPQQSALRSIGVSKSTNQVQQLTPFSQPKNLVTANRSKYVDLNESKEAPAFIPLGPLIIHSQLPSCSFKQPQSQPHSSASYSEVQTFKLHFEGSTPIKLMDQLSSNENLGEQESINQQPSMKSLESPHKLASLDSQESLVINRGFENFANPEDFVASLSTIRSIQDSDSVSLQKICSSTFFRKVQPLQQKPYAQYFPYIIKEDPHNEQTDSCGPSAQGSNLRSSGTSVAQQLKSFQEESRTSIKSPPTHKKFPLSSESIETPKKKPSSTTSPEITAFDYQFDRRTDLQVGTIEKLRCARIVQDTPKMRLPRNNLAQWELQ